MKNDQNLNERITIRISDNDSQIIDFLAEEFDAKSRSELLRFLIQAINERVEKMKESI